MQICKLKKLKVFRHVGHGSVSIIAIHPNGSFCSFTEGAFAKSPERCLEFSRKGVCSLRWNNDQSWLYNVSDRTYFTPRI